MGTLKRDNSRESLKIIHEASLNDSPYNSPRTTGTIHATRYRYHSVYSLSKHFVYGSTYPPTSRLRLRY